ncbi:MAG: hypothetical protein ABL966_10255 [Acidimicrobiales bacterium]
MLTAKVAIMLALAVVASCGSDSPERDGSEEGFVTIADVGNVRVSVRGDLLCWESDIASVVCGPGPSDAQPVTQGYSPTEEDPVEGDRYLWGLVRSDVTGFDVLVPDENPIRPEIHRLDEGALDGLGVWVVVVDGPAHPVAQHLAEITVANVEMT